MKQARPTVICNDVAVAIDSAETDTRHLWLTTEDLSRATKLELKPQGVCRDEKCFPLPEARRQEFVRQNSGKTWFNLTAFAELVDQPVAYENSSDIAAWYFGLRSDQRQELVSLQAPDFTLPDIDGRLHSLSDFRGKKVFLVTWASW